jgi:hypothetical protein
MVRFLCNIRIMKLIYKHENRAIVYSIKNILELNEIDTHVKNEYGSPMGAEFGLSNTLLELWLSNEQDYEKALSIIETQTANPTDESPWLCRKCGEENEGNFQVCWKCQNEYVASS